MAAAHVSQLRVWMLRASLVLTSYEERLFKQELHVERGEFPLLGCLQNFHPMWYMGELYIFVPASNPALVILYRMHRSTRNK